MHQASVSSLFKRAIAYSGLLSWWEDRVTDWPRVICYHYVGDEPSFFVGATALPNEIFVEQILCLKRRYRFLTWQEYKEALSSPRKARRSVLLTFDDGFRSSWDAARQLVDEHRVPAVFFLNTRVLDNAYAPWMTRSYFLRSQGGGKFLQPLWDSISGGTPLSPEAARKRCHECFSLAGVVQPIEKALARFGMTPAELADSCQLYIRSTDIQQRSKLIEIGNHSHSHYILSKLSSTDLDKDLRSSHQILKELSGTDTESFAYPFGIPGANFNERCLRILHGVSPYPYIFSAVDGVPLANLKWTEKGRVCLDDVQVRDVVGTVAKVTPRTLKAWLTFRPRSGE